MADDPKRRPFDAECRDCHAPIVWARSTRKDGSPCNMAFDPEPSEGGRYALSYPGGDKTKLVARYVQQGSDWPEGTVPRSPHYITCTARKPREA